MASKTRICLILACLFLNIVLQPAICRAWEDFPKDSSSNYLDSYSDDDYQTSDSSDDSAEDFFKGGYYEDDDTDYSAYSDDPYASDSDAGENAGVDSQVVPARPPLLEPGAPINLAEKSIRLGRIPYRSLREMMAQAVPLLRLLQKKSGAKEVRLVSNRNDYASVIDALARDNIDFAWVGPTAYLSRRDKDHLMPVAKAKFGAATTYRGVFIALAKGKVQGLEDLKGAKIGFVDPESTSGYIYPLYLLLQLGINPYRDSKVFFLKNHDNVLCAVLAGKVEAGVCLEDTLNSIKDKSVLDKIIVLGKTNEIPSDVIVCRQDCPLNLREKFLEALLSVKENDIPGSPTFLQAFDEDFIEVEGVMKFIEAKKQGK